MSRSPCPSEVRMLSRPSSTRTGEPVTTQNWYSVVNPGTEHVMVATSLVVDSTAEMPWKYIGFSTLRITAPIDSNHDRSAMLRPEPESITMVCWRWSRRRCGRVEETAAVTSSGVEASGAPTVVVASTVVVVGASPMKWVSSLAAVVVGWVWAPGGVPPGMRAPHCGTHVRWGV